MGGGDFTGNGSVEWDVHGDCVRQHDSRPTSAMGRKHSGTDETPEGPVRYFTIVIKRPKDPTEQLTFLNSLRAALDGAKDLLVVKLPIEDQDHGGPTQGQISVRWPSRPPDATFKGGAVRRVSVAAKTGLTGS